MGRVEISARPFCWVFALAGRNLKTPPAVSLHFEAPVLAVQSNCARSGAKRGDHLTPPFPLAMVVLPDWASSSRKLAAPTIWRGQFFWC